MFDWIKTTQAIVATVAALFATMLVWWNLGLPRLVFDPEAALIHTRIEALEQRHRSTARPQLPVPYPQVP